MLLALTTQNKILLGGMGAIFIAFALVAAFLIPRVRPDFPGERGVWPFAIASFVLFVGMMLAVELFAVEDEEAEAHAAGATEINVGATEFRFDVPEAEGVQAGRHVFRLTNSGQSRHNLVVEGPGVKRKATPEIEPGKSAQLAVELRPGRYVLYCSVPGHRDAGMEKELDVE